MTATARADELPNAGRSRSGDRWPTHRHKARRARQRARYERKADRAAARRADR